MNPLSKNIRRYISLKLLVVLSVFIITISVSVVLIGALGVYGDTLRGIKPTVSGILKKKDKEVRFEKAQMEPTSSNGNGVYIKRPTSVILKCDGVEKRIMTDKKFVKEVLDAEGIVLNELDLIQDIKLEDNVTKEMNIDIIRIEEKEEVVNNDLKFKVEKIENGELDSGVVEVKRNGETGVEELKYKVVYENNLEKTRELVEQKIIKEPINEIIEIGTKTTVTTNKGENFSFKKVLNMRATAYTASYADTGKHPGDPGFGITYTGKRVKRGIIAVDPQVIPLGTKVYIEGVNCSSYGYAEAADIGGAIKGDLIDLYFDTSREVKNWGVRKVKVFILE